jgi:hypothetical protein
LQGFTATSHDLCTSLLQSQRSSWDGWLSSVVTGVRYTLFSYKCRFQNCLWSIAEHKAGRGLKKCGLGLFAGLGLGSGYLCSKSGLGFCSYAVKSRSGLGSGLRA